MTMPTAAVNTSNLDAGTDSRAAARVDLLDAVTKLNQIIDHIEPLPATLLNRTTAALMRGDLGVNDAVFAYAESSAAFIEDVYEQIPLSSTRQKGSALSGSVFTAPRAGWVRVTIAQMAYTVESGTVTSVNVSVFKNGTITTPAFNALAGTGGGISLNQVLQVAANDTIDIRAIANGSGSRQAALGVAGICFEMLDGTT